jgi:hypothetical protein
MIRTNKILDILNNAGYSSALILEDCGGATLGCRNLISVPRDCVLVSRKTTCYNVDFLNEEWGLVIPVS